MKTNYRRNAKKNRGGAKLVTALALTAALALGGGIAAGVLPMNQAATAETTQAEITAPVQDNSPAIYVNEKNTNSVVGIITNSQGWTRNGGVQDTPISEGSGVVIAEGGYVLTNYHVVEGGNSYQVLMPNGEKVDATLTGTDSALDLAVLQVNEQADALVPVSIGSTANLKVGSTVIAIGNPGGEELANTVTQGIVSALNRSSASSSNTTRNVNYIQHDASISSGNSGGGLFDFQGNLVGINTLKMASNGYSSGSYEGLGFAIPVETAYPIAQQLIENGRVIRPQMGVTVADQDGPDEPLNDYAPASVMIAGVNAGTPAEKAGLKQYDFITAVNGQKITSVRELTTLLDTFKAGDTVTVTVVRYNNVNDGTQANNGNSNGYGNYYGGFPYGFGFGDFFGNYGGYGSYGGNDSYGNYGSYSNGNSGSVTVSGGYTVLDIDVTLEVLDQQ